MVSNTQLRSRAPPTARPASPAADGLRPPLHRTDCTPKWKAAHPSTPIRFFKGKDPKEYTGEASIRAAIKKNGALWCSMMVANDFMAVKTNVIYEVGAGQNANGGHAIVLYGWGEESGVKYWKGINSWGSGWGYGGKSLFRIKRGVNTADIEKSCWKIDPYQDIQGFAPPLPPRPPPPPSPPPCVQLDFIMDVKSYGSVRSRRPGPGHLVDPSPPCPTCPSYRLLRVYTDLHPSCTPPTSFVHASRLHPVYAGDQLVSRRSHQLIKRNRQSNLH